MKVCLVITGLGMGGAERVVTGLADALVLSGCEVLLVYLTGPLEVRPFRSEVGVVCLGINSRRGFVSAYFRLRKILREFRPDIVHSHLFSATILARLMRMSLSIPRMISTMHTTDPGGRLRAMAYRSTDWLTDISTNVSSEAVDRFVANHAVRTGRMVAVHNGIAIDDFRAMPAARARVRDGFALDDNCKLFLAVGRLSWAKDYPGLFNALVRLPHNLRFKLLIAGDGPLRPQLEKLADDLGLSSNVQFLGIRPDIADLMCAADVFVLSSVLESFGLVVAEAMACECVVVATDSGGVREVLGNAGFLVPVGDPGALATSLLTASSLSRDDAVALGKSARQRVVDTYSFDRSVAKWRELYGESGEIALSVV